MIARSIQKTLEGARMCMCVLLCRSRCVGRKKKKVGERVGEEGSQRIPPFHSTALGGTSWAGTNWCKINFPVGYNDPEQCHTSMDQWHRKRPVSAPRASNDYLALDCLATTLGTKTECVWKSCRASISVYENVECWHVLHQQTLYYGYSIKQDHIRRRMLR